MQQREAMFYETIEDKKVHCTLCPHHCRIKPDQLGACGVRRNRDGVLYGESYGQLTSLALDPVEKKPLAHFLPGHAVLSVGSYGCNFQCSFCQNHSISMDKPETTFVSPETLVEKALSLKKSGNIGIAYTYNEPLISYEYVYDCSKAAKERDLKNVVVSNGYINQEPLKQLLPFIDAMNIDLKSFGDAFYKSVCKGSIEPVKESIKTAARECHIEVTTLIIPEANDSNEEIDALASWLSSISPEIPLHLSRFFPRHKMKHAPVTPVETILRLAKIAKQHLKHVHTGNL